MRAAYYSNTGSPEVLQVGNVPDIVPGSNESKVKVAACGINPIDTYWLSGLRQGPSPLPRIPCVDAAGVDEKTGKRVWLCGGSGGAAEYLTAPSHLLHEIPGGVSFEQAAAIPTVFKTAYGVLIYRGELKAGQSVLVQGGAGAVGQIAIQMAKALGAKVATTVSSDDKAQIVRELGADVIINYRKQNVVEEIKKALDGVDVIVEVSTSENIEIDQAVINAGGKIINIGSPKNFTPQIPLVGLNTKNAGLLGFMVFSMPAEEHRKAAEFINTGFKKYGWRFPALKTFALDQIREAFTLQMSHNWVGKVIVKIS